MIYLLDLFGVAVFAVAGSLKAGRRSLDLFGIVVVALATALGGGTLRDVALGAYPIFWISDPTFVLVAVAASCVTFALAQFRKPPKGILQVADAFGLAVFTVIGAQKAASMGVSPVIAVIMGVMTGVAGGLIRDVLFGEIPLILRKEIYATASLLGAVAFVAMLAVIPNESLSIAVAVVIVLALRLAAIKWELSLPVFRPTDHEDGNGE